ncbi:ABC transporter ATP-binding protein [Rubripirellula sp.]|nr:ABC transporter ATP-binding protein [Rubripirellula sp.]MDB4339020.1 ABC transporter ATP-binding protein [Rubripirellula sp.]
MVVTTHNLTKRYAGFSALSDCCLNVAEGEIFGLLGPNGAGKTTLIRSLLGYLTPTSGGSTVCGFDPQLEGVSVRKQVAYLPGDARLPRHMRGSSVLRFFSEMHPFGDLERSRMIADQLELNQKRHVAFMSTGMRQKLALAVVLSLKTPLLILDEPTANLDPTIRAIVLDFVLEAKRAGRTVIFSSHVLSEIEQTCDRVAFLRQGQLALELSMGDLHQRHRVWGSALDNDVSAPENAGERVVVHRETTMSKSDAENSTSYRIDLAGDLADWLPWLQGLSLEQMRIEPLGLRAVYDSVHFGNENWMEGTKE